MFKLLFLFSSRLADEHHIISLFTSKWKFWHKTYYLINIYLVTSLLKYFFEKAFWTCYSKRKYSTQVSGSISWSAGKQLWYFQSFCSIFRQYLPYLTYSSAFDNNTNHFQIQNIPKDFEQLQKDDIEIFISDDRPIYGFDGKPHPQPKVQ